MKLREASLSVAALRRRPPSPQRHEPARSYFNAPKMYRAAFEVDWRRLRALQRFERFLVAICGDDAALRAEKEEQLKDVFRAHYEELFGVYEYCCATGSGNNPFSLSMNAFMGLSLDCEFVDNARLTTAELSNIFVAVNVEEGDRGSAENKANDDRALARSAGAAPARAREEPRAPA